MGFNKGGESEERDERGNIAHRKMESSETRMQNGPFMGYKNDKFSTMFKMFIPLKRCLLSLVTTPHFITPHSTNIYSHENLKSHIGEGPQVGRRRNLVSIPCKCRNFLSFPKSLHWL